MVLRIFRDGICRPNKFRRPKINGLHSIQRSTSSDQPPDDYALGSHQFDDPNDPKRPIIFIAHTVFDTSKDGDKNPMTLLESLKDRLASQPGFQQDLHIDEVQKIKASDKDESTAVTDKQGDQFSKDENAWRIVFNDSDITKDDRLLQRPKSTDDRDDYRTVVDSPNLMPSYIRSHDHRQYEIQTEEQMFDELAKKYLTMERDQIDKHLAEDMERLGLPINTSEAVRSSININISCNIEASNEIDVPNTSDSQQTEVIDTNPQYYDQLSWCNRYFKESGSASEKEGVDEIRTDCDAHIATLHDNMLPLHCCVDFDPFENNNEPNSPIEKLGVDEQFHLLQRMDFIQLDSKVTNDKISYLDDLTVDESLPIHLYLQGNLIDDVSTAPQPITELYDLIAPFEETEYNLSKEPVSDVFHSLMVQDMDVTKFDYTFPREYPDDASITLCNQLQSSRYQTMEEKSTQESDATIEIEAQTMPKIEKDQKADLLEHLTVKNVMKTKAAEQMDATEKEQTAVTNDKITHAIPKTKTDQKADILERLTIKNVMTTKAAEQMDATEKEQTAVTNAKITHAIPKTKTDQKADILERLTITNVIKTKVPEQMDATQKDEKTVANDKIIHAIPKTENNHKADLLEPLKFKDVTKTKVAEQKEISQKEQDTVTNDKITHSVVQMKPHEVPKTEAEIRNLINAKVMEQIGAPNTIQPQRHERIDTLVQMNPHALPKPEPFMNIIHAKVLEQIGAHNTLQGTAQPVNVSMKPQKTTNIDWEQTVIHPEPPKERKVIKDNAASQNIKESVASAKQAKLKEEETKQPSRETETIVQSWVHTVPANEAQKIARDAESIPEALDDAVNKLSLDLNLSLSELLRRVRARNRLKYLHDIRAQVQNMSTVTSEKRCPPSDRPQCPPPPDCAKPCPPPAKRKCPPEPPKCPPDPPKCPPEPPKCPTPKNPPKCPPDPPKCPPDPPKCPPEPKCPCPCPPPPKCPPDPPKCPCQATNPDDPVTIEPSLGQSLLWSYLRSGIESIKIRFLESRNRLAPVKEDPDLEIASLKLNRIRDFEPWTPIPSWPFPVEYKKRKLQCPYHGCPIHKPGPVRPNCPELPCAGFPKRLCFSDTTVFC